MSISEVSNTARAAKNGDFTCQIPLDEKEGFYRELAQDLNDLNQATLAGVQKLKKVMFGLSQGELDLSMEGDFAGSFAKLQHDCNQTMEQLKRLIGTIEISIDAVKRKNLTHDIETQTMAGFFKRMAEGLNSMTSSMALTVSDVAHDVSELSNMSTQIDMANQNLRNVHEITLTFLLITI